MKFNFQKFAGLVESMGSDLACQGETIAKNANSIQAESDVHLFILNNKSSNCNIAKEEFQPYNSEQMGKKFQ
jgi:ACT domain-containing protein